MVRTSAETEIRARIARLGKITFAEFMELALYHPQDGYYARGGPARQSRDYYTSPAAHPAFGALMSIQLWRMWEALKRPSPFYAVEMGAGEGLLARDVVAYAPEVSRPFAEALWYVAMDRSREPAPPDGSSSHRHRIVADQIPARGVIGCFLSNELVDAFPVHRFQVQDGEVMEVYVSVDNERLVEVLDEPPTPLLTHRVQALPHRVPDGYRGEANLGIGQWMSQVAAALSSGFVVTVDYGYDAAELYSLRRSAGTLETFYRHTDGASPYGRIGTQDITAHVDFSALVSEGEAVGLRTIGLCTQAQLLHGLGIRGWLQKLRTEELVQRERDANAMAMRDLVRPDGLGGFRVLVQEKGTGVTELAQLSPAGDPDALTAGLPVPLLRPDHLPLMEGRYPHAGWQWDQ